MQPENQIVKQEHSPMEVTIHTPNGDVKLTPAIVRKYLVNGNGAITEQEIALFLGLCKAQQLNPFTREAYLIKYGGNQPAAIVVAKDVFLKRAYRSESFKGHKAGVICQVPNNPALEYTQGICPPGAKIVGGWAEVHTDGWAFPLRVEVDFNEYQARKHDGTPNRMWSEKPATMIRKVALVQALREAFPDNYQGMYSEEEIPTQDDLPRNPVDQSQVIDVGQQEDPQKNDEGETLAQQPQGNQEFRRRRHKFRVDPVIFGANEVMTCGCTAEQLVELHAIAKGNPEIKKWISSWVKDATGYDQWSFMRHDEAHDLLEQVRQRYVNDVSAEATDEPVSNPQPQEKIENQPNAQQQNPMTMPDDLVECPMGDRVSVSQYCKTNCRERKAQGWCPVIDDPPPAMEGGML